MKLKELRQRKGLTQLDMAKFCNISKTAYFNYENNLAEPNIEMLIKLANYFNVTVDYLIENDNNNNNVICLFDNETKNFVETYQSLNQLNRIKANSYILGLLANQ